MFSLAELQNSRAALKKRTTEPGPDPGCAEPTITQGARRSSVSSPDGDNFKTNIPLPTISLQTLAAAKSNLFKIPTLRSPTSTRIQSVVPKVDDQDDVVLPAFARRKELFEKQKTHISNSPPTAAVVRVHNGSEEQIFTVDIKTLRSSPRFREELRETGGLEELHLIDHVPLAFQLFLDFCQRPDEPVKYQPGHYSREPWISSSAPAWVLAVDVGARRFEKYALSQFIQNCAIIAKGPWAYIEERAADGSSLWRFSKHWIAWNISFSHSWTHEYVGLEAADLAHCVTPKTRDPRIFDIDHWYKECGDDFNALCEHNPLYREEQREVQARKSKPPPAEWGEDQELKAQRRSSG